VFNMGIGMVVVVPEKNSEEIIDHIERLGEQAHIIGHITNRDDKGPAITFE